MQQPPYEILRNVQASGQNVLIIGAGKTGLSVAQWCLDVGLKPIVSDKNTTPIGSEEQIEKLKSAGVPFILGEDKIDFERVGAAIISPGVPPHAQRVLDLKDRSVPMFGELELATSLLKSKCIAVTGSNGKSTTVSLIHHALKVAGIESILCGNIGTPVIEYAPKSLTPCKGAEYTVIEASSYQLDQLKGFKPEVSVWLNLSQNHLERHGTMERYLEAKRAIFIEQDQNCFAVLNRDDQYYDLCKRGIKSEIATFGQTDILEPDLNSVKTQKNQARIFYKPKVDKNFVTLQTTFWGEVAIDCTTIALIGLHNRYNIAAAALVASRVGICVSNFERALKTFLPLEHRQEVVRTDSQDRIWINDTKGTTVAATQAALKAVAEAYPQRQLYLLCGGLAKAGSWNPLMQQIQSLPKVTLLCFGADGKLIANYANEKNIDSPIFTLMDDAVLYAQESAVKNSVILLSPGCASYDQFKGFEERGAHFKKLVQ